MEKTYNPQQIEQRWYPFWEQSGYFTPKPGGKPYCIMLPPPNVTGTLHMGHGFQITLMDALIRYHRMCGDNVLWQVGTDHAGIATQMVVERQLLTEGKNRQQLGREAFVERVWQWKEQSDSTIKKQIRRMGASVDWHRERFSLDADINQAVIQVFIALHENNLLYRGKRLVNWDPVLLTAVSDLEAVPHQEQGSLWYLRYPVQNSSEVLIVATTRPETLLGDVAVAVHPQDSRYQHLIGQYICLPLTDRLIPIIADDYVDPEFGSGCVKITPAHDFNDYAIGQRHHLPLITIFTPTAHLNEEVPETYRGMERFAARARIVDDLQKLGLLEKIVPHLLQVPRGEKSGAVLEPYSTDQWYIRMKPLAEAAHAAVAAGDIQFFPENWRKTYFQWLDNIQDWCISRQLWWGHRIPAWYDREGNVYVAESEAAVRSKYHLANEVVLTQDEDVLDTWVSASLWPFVTLGWPKQTSDLQTYYPTSVLVTGFDILFFWVARMVMMGLKFTGQVPFSQVYLTGLIRDKEGQKMSKTRGNVLDPIDLIDGIDLDALVKKRTANLLQPDRAEKISKDTRREFPQGIAAFGVDALRFTYCALASTGRNINFDLGRLEGYRNFCNKLWNAARFVLMHTEEHASTIATAERQLSLADRWILSALSQTIEQVTSAFADYRFDLLAATLYEFTWNSYCDWYLELAKPVLVSEEVSAAEKNGTRHTLLYVLATLLRLIHPIMPFITEEIWQRVRPLIGEATDTIMLTAYPTFDAKQIDSEANQEITWLQEIVLSLRQIRSESSIAPGKKLPLLLQKGDAQDCQRMERHRNLLMSLARLSSIDWLAADQPPPLAATALVNQLELFIPLGDVIDKSAEIQRLTKEIAKWEKELQRLSEKLANTAYLEKAPAEVVNKERVRAQEGQEQLAKLQVQLERMQGK